MSLHIFLTLYEVGNFVFSSNMLQSWCNSRENISKNDQHEQVLNMYHLFSAVHQATNFSSKFLELSKLCNSTISFHSGVCLEKNKAIYKSVNLCIIMMRKEAVKFKVCTIYLPIISQRSFCGEEKIRTGSTFQPQLVTSSGIKKWW